MSSTPRRHDSVEVLQLLFIDLMFFLAVFTSFVSPEHVKPMRQLVECAKYPGK